jgi:UDP-glucose 4-epimerase
MGESPKVLLIGAAGYIGSFLTKFFNESPNFGKLGMLGTCDIRSSPNVNIVGSYLDIPGAEIEKYSHILFFAGCSSVQEALQSPKSALYDNCINPLRFAEALAPHQSFIYASSASVYSSDQVYVGESRAKLSGERDSLGHPKNPYDASKAAADYLFSIGQTAARVTGLRMGTVSGYSPTMRAELVFNSMVNAASTDKCLTLKNPTSWRTILFLDDLANLLMALLQSNEKLPPIINAGSVSMTLGDLASRISAHLNAEVRHLPDSATYSFALNTELHRSFSPVADLSLEERVDQYLREKQQNAK